MRDYMADACFNVSVDIGNPIVPPKRATDMAACGVLDFLHHTGQTSPETRCKLNAVLPPRCLLRDTVASSKPAILLDP